jgi:hypothetical protein
MRIDRTHRKWAIASAAFLALCIAIYVPYALNAPQGPHGGSAIGLLFGIIGFAFMLFAAALGARKRVPVWRLGRAQTWMRGHLWLGLLSLPLILLHGGFHFGGTLTRVLMWLLIITVASGMFGAALQHYLPHMMTTDIPLETIYAEIANVRKLLGEEADRNFESLCGPLGLSKSAEDSGQRAGGFTALRPISVLPSGASSASVAVAAAAEITLLTGEQAAPLRHFYLDEMRPFLESPRSRRSRLANSATARNAFTGLRTLLPPAAHSTLEDLQDICDEARQLSRQESLHHWLHGWLLLHIPLSLALTLLGAVHAVMALKFSS